MKRACLDCGQLTDNNSRCPGCTTRRARTYRTAHPTTPRHRPHHTDPNYRRISKQLRTEWTADPLTRCWLCGDHARLGDPWQADHVFPGQLDSPLAPAHRSCNARRGGQQR